MQNKSPPLHADARAAKGEIIEQGRIILIRVQQLNGSERFFLDALVRAPLSCAQKERRKEATSKQIG